MNAQSIANFEGKLIYVALTNDSIKKGTIVNVNGEYFMLKAECEAKARDIIYYDEVKSITLLEKFDGDYFEALQNKYLRITLENGAVIQGVISVISKGSLSLYVDNAYADIHFNHVVKCEVISRLTRGENLSLVHGCKCFIVGWKDERNVVVSISSDDLFILTSVKEDKAEEQKTKPDRLSEILSKVEENKPQEVKAELPQKKEEVIKYRQNGKIYRLRNMYRDGKYGWEFYNEDKSLARGVYPLNDEERLKNIKYIAKKLHSIENLDKYISANAYLNLGKIAHDTIGNYLDIFPLFKASYERARDNVSVNIIRNKYVFSKNKEQIAIVVQFTNLFLEYCKLNDPSKLSDAFDVKDKIDAFMSKRGYTLENLTQSQVGNPNVSGKMDFIVDKRRNILYRNKPKTVTIVSTYTRNGSEYAVVTDHTDNDKTKTLFIDKIQYIN